MRMPIQIRQLLIIRQIAQSGSFNSAAEKLHISQPAVTQTVAEFERRIGGALFVRSHAGVTLTEAGHVVLARISRALEHLQEGVGDLNRSPSGLSRANRFDALRRVSRAQLAALVAVAQHRNLTLAARQMGVAQSTFHRSARELERRLGVQLFERTSFGVVPTLDAERLALRARLASAEIDQARAEVLALAGGASGCTVIGAMPLARSFLIPEAVLEFARSFPEHDISIMDGTYNHLLAALRNGEADFLVGALREPGEAAGVVQEHLFDDPLSIIMRAGHPLAHQKSVSTSVLARYPWIAPRSGSPLCRHFDALFASRGIKPPLARIQCNSLIASRALLMQSDRLMLLSAQQTHYELQAGMLVSLPHPDGRIVRRIGLTMRENWMPTQAQRRLLDLLRRHSPVS